MIGRQIANYRIVEKLGEGGMGVVYKAMDESLDRAVAIKALSSELSHDPQLVERFRTEAKAQAHLNHTNIATLYSFLVQEGDCFMVMEFVEGESFDQMIRRRGPIPHQEAIPLFKQALLGLGFAHRMGIIHRDIKPGNMMVNRNGIVKVMDFGIAKVMGGRRLTRTGTQMGTVYYMSPEQIRGATLDVRSDIYTLGVMLYELLTAHLPFEGENDYQIMSDHVNTSPPPPSRFYPYLPKGVENAVLKALEKDPNARFQSVEEFGAALEHPEALAAGTQQAVIPAAGLRPTVIESGAATAPAFRPGTAPPTPAPATPGFGEATTPHAGAAATPPLPAPGPGFWTPGKLIAIGGGALAVLVIVIVAVVALQQSRPPRTAGGGAGGSTVAMGPSGDSPPPLAGPEQGGGPPGDRAKSNENENGSGTPLPSPNKIPGLGPVPPGPVKPTPSATPIPPAARPGRTPPQNEQPRAPAPERRVEPTTSSQAVEVNRLLQKAEQAYQSGKFLDPSDSSALYFARQVRLLDRNHGGAADIENRVFQVMFNRAQAARQGHSFDEALDQVNRLIALFPERSELYSLKQAIVNEQQQYAEEQERLRKEQERRAIEAQFKKFTFRHRHMYTKPGDYFPTLVAWCVGVMTVQPAGTVSFDCERTEDQYQGQCHHVVFPLGSINALRGGGSLHLSVKGQGNYDFFGENVQGAYEAIASFVSRKK